MGVGRPAAATVAGGVRGFAASLTSFIGWDGPVCEVAGLLEEYWLATVTGLGLCGERSGGSAIRALNDRVPVPHHRPGRGHEVVPRRLEAYLLKTASLRPDKEGKKAYACADFR
jgi:hypothetical protein